ncbi:hypothetical protein B0H11DRAFT_2222434 [Mycena galericulata]|nr:hypothetical protein B0H11DRAFT_2222434 [Mycena galericulata]
MDIANSLDPMEDIETFPAKDTRVFSTRRLLSFYGYSSQTWTPIVDDVLSFQVPKIERYHGREVIIGRQRVELWSPNSLQNAYFPGRSPGPVSQPADDFTHRRYNGGWGVHDPMYAPQVYDPTRFWLGCIQRNVDGPDYEDACRHWRSEPDAEYFGHLSRDYCKRLTETNKDLDEQMRLCSGVEHSRRTMWSNRPRIPWNDQMAELPKIEIYETAIDRVVTFQRGMREKRAWLAAAHFWSGRIPRVEDMRKEPILEAFENYVGVWINGITEEEGLIFLTRMRVPCFVVHVLDRNEPRGEVVLEDTMTGTLLDRYSDPSAYEYDRVALSTNGGVYTLSVEPPKLKLPLPTRSAIDRERSASRWQMKLKPSDHLPRSWFYPDLELTKREGEARQGDYFHEVEIAPGFPSWLRPPPIIGAPPHSKWRTFVETRRGATHDWAMVHDEVHPDRALQSNETCWYDRRNARRLYLVTQCEPIEGYFSGEEFGRPAPRMSYVRSFHGEAVVEAFSSWMYITETVEAKDVGKREKKPKPQEFMARFTTDAQSAEDALSLGPESDNEEMQVDPVAPARLVVDTKKETAAETKQRALPAPTFPSLEQILLTPYVLFPQMPGTFEIVRMVGWLNAVSKAVEGCVWRELHRFERKPRVDYIVRMRSKEDALKLRGVVGTEVEIRESRFLSEHEYRTMLTWPGIMKAGENAEPLAPYRRFPPPPTRPLRDKKTVIDVIALDRRDVHRERMIDGFLLVQAGRGRRSGEILALTGHTTLPLRVDVPVPRAVVLVPLVVVLVPRVVILALRIVVLHLPFVASAPNVAVHWIVVLVLGRNLDHALNLLVDRLDALGLVPIVPSRRITAHLGYSRG